MLGPDGATLPQSRVNALWSLEGLNALTEADLLIGLNDRISQVRAQAVKLAARRLSQSPELLKKVLALAEDSDAAVRFQTALALGESDDPTVAIALFSIARRDAEDPWMRAAVLSSARASAEKMLVDLCDDPEVRGSRSASADAKRVLLDQLAQIVGAQRQARDRARTRPACEARERCRRSRAARRFDPGSGAWSEAIRWSTRVWNGSNQPWRSLAVGRG